MQLLGVLSTVLQEQLRRLQGRAEVQVPQEDLHPRVEPDVESAPEPDALEITLLELVAELPQRLLEHVVRAARREWLAVQRGLRVQ